MPIQYYSNRPGKLDNLASNARENERNLLQTADAFVLHTWELWKAEVLKLCLECGLGYLRLENTKQYQTLGTIA